jgi:hypothetical protein
MWKQEIHKLLEINQIPFDFVQNQTVFEMLFIPQHQLYLHLIDIKSFHENDLPENYFQDFSDKFNSQNQRIIHLWEDVYFFKKDLVQSRILSILGKFIRLHARHCIIKRIDKSITDKFLKINHLQGSVKAKLKYGLFLKPQYVERFVPVVGEDTNHGNKPLLIAIATFSGGRTMKEGERKGTRSFELIRFASLKGYVAVGGMDKLMSAFTNEHHPFDIMSYADRDWSDGRSYDKLGFSKIENSLPQILYINLKTLERLPLNWLTDDEHLEIFNAGSIKFIKNIQTKKSSTESVENF